MDVKTCVVTGATSGIGKEIARGLAQRGHSVGILCRNPAKAEATVAELRESAPKATIETFLADLSVLADVRRVAAELNAHYDTLDVLVNNAGVHDMRARKSADGFDQMIATNHLGPFLLTSLLRELLEKSAPARVVVVASEAHRNAGQIDPMRFAEPGSYGRLGSFRAYARSKLLNILFTQELAARLAGTGVTANSMCPGLVATGLVPDIQRLGAVLARSPFVRTPEQGARMAIRLATDERLEGRTGGFYSTTPGARLLPPVRARSSVNLQRALWDHSAALVDPTPDPPALGNSAM